MKRRTVAGAVKEQGRTLSENHKKNLKVKSHWSQIKSDPSPSEFEIQAFIYNELRQRGHHIRGEVKALTRSKFDLVVFTSDGKPIRIIEVKKLKQESMLRLAKRSKMGVNTLRSLETQIRKYMSYEIPVDLVMGMDDAYSYVERFKIDAPSKLPESLLDLKGWDGVVSPEDWLMSQRCLERGCDKRQMMFAEACRNKGDWVLQKICYRQDVGSTFVKAITPGGKLRCIIEFSHGIASEPDDLKALRYAAGREIAKENMTFLIRIEGDANTRRACKKMRTGKSPMHQSSHLVDRDSSKAYAEMIRVERSGLSEEYKAIVAG